MHELAIAENIVTAVLAEMARRRISRIRAIGLRIGDLTDVVPEALEFGFEAITKDTDLEKTELKIEHIPLKGRCNSCRQEFPLERYLFICPECGSHDVDVIEGQELDIAFLEVDDDETTEQNESDAPEPGQEDGAG